MSGQSAQKGGQQGQQPNPYQNQQGMQSMMPGYGGGYFSQGNSNRAQLGGALGNFNPNQPFSTQPTAPVNPISPLAGNPGTGINMPGGGYGNNPFAVGPGTMSPFAGTAAGGINMGNYGSGSGSLANQPNQYQPTAPSTNDPNSAEYAAYYYGLAPSTRAYMQAPGSAQANSSYQSWLAGQNDPNQAHF
jgi:hypothetical protein